MPNVPVTANQFDAGVYQIETNDPVVGGAAGISNKQAIALANRTAFLKAAIDAVITGEGGTPDNVDPTLLYAAIQAAIAAEKIPVSAVIPFFGGTLHAGFLKANAAAVSRTSYAALFAEIGTTFGAGDGSTTFNLPDSRGEFLRGWDDGRGVDVGRTLGSSQVDDYKSHRHAISSKVLQNVSGGALAIANQFTGTAWGLTNYSGGTETRPRNLSVQFLIKY